MQEGSFIGMEESTFIVKYLKEKPFSVSELPVNWLTPRNYYTHFEDFNVFIQTAGTFRRFVAKTERVRHTAYQNPNPLKTCPSIAYVHLEKDLWFQAESFEVFSVHTPQGHRHYSDSIFVTIPGTYLIYTARFDSISTPAPQPQPQQLQEPLRPLYRPLRDFYYRMNRRMLDAIVNWPI